MEHDPVKAAVEELAGLDDTFRVLKIMARAAERRSAESESALNALLKAVAVVGALQQAQQAKVLALRTEAERALGGAAPA